MDTRQGDERIWTAAELARFATHDHAELARWATRRLSLHEPEALTELFPTLIQRDDGVIRHDLLEHLETSDGPLPADSLRALAASDTSLSVRATALLAIGGDPEARAALHPFDAIGGLSWAAWAARDAAGCRGALLALHAELGPAYAAERFEWLTAVATPEDLPLLLELVHDESPDGYIEPEELADLLLAAAHLAPLYDLEAIDLDGVVDHVGGWSDEVTGGAAPHGLRLPIEALVAAHEAADWQALTAAALAACKDLVRSRPTEIGGAWIEGLIAALEGRDENDEIDELDAAIAVTLAVELASVCELTGVTARLSLDSLLRIQLEGPLCFATRAEALIHERLGHWDALAPAERDAATAVLIRALSEPETLDDASALVRKLAGTPLWEPGAALAERGFTDWDLLSDDPPRLREVASELLGRDAAASDALLPALVEQPYRWASRLVVERLDELLRCCDPIEVWATVEELADSSCLDDLVTQWREGDRAAARCIGLVAMCAGRSDDLPEDLLVEAEEVWLERRGWEGAMAGGDGWLAAPGRLREGPLRLDLRCLDCSRTHTYETGTVVLHPRGREVVEGWDGIFLGRIITCKSCGAVDRYEIPARACGRITAELLSTLGRPDDGPPRIVHGEPALYDGTLMTRPSAAIAHLRGLAEASPEAGEPLRRLGNLYRYLRMPDEAERAWRQAVEVDDTEAEAAYSLAMAAWARRDRGALDLVLDALCRVPAGRFGDDILEVAVDGLVSRLAEAAPFASPPLALVVSLDRGRTDGTVTVAVTAIDLRRIRYWDRLVDLLCSGTIRAVSFTTNLPEREGILDRLLGRSAPARLSGIPRGSVEPAAKKAKRRAKAKAARKARKKNRPKKSKGRKR